MVSAFLIPSTSKGWRGDLRTWAVRISGEWVKMSRTSTSVPQAAYGPGFFESNAQSSMQSAQEIVPLVLEMLAPSSVIDVGCGSGGWLRVLAEHGVRNYLGVDQENAASGHLQISPDHFVAADLSEALPFPGRFDLALCLEVVEHLPLSVGVRLVQLLTQVAPTVLFSAGIPIQPGTGHISGRWPRFWASEFAKHGFQTLDVIRRRVWSNRRVSFWYAQNMVLYIEAKYYSTHPSLHTLAPSRPETLRSLVHPRMFTDGLDMVRRSPKSTVLKLGSQVPAFFYSLRKTL